MEDDEEGEDYDDGYGIKARTDVTEEGDEKSGTHPHSQSKSSGSGGAMKTCTSRPPDDEDRNKWGVKKIRIMDVEALSAKRKAAVIGEITRKDIWPIFLWGELPKKAAELLQQRRHG